MPYNNSYVNHAGTYREQCLLNIIGHAGEGHTWGAVNGAFRNQGNVASMASHDNYYSVAHFYFSASYSNNTYRDNCAHIQPYNYSVYVC